MDHKPKTILQNKFQQNGGGKMYGFMAADKIINGEETSGGFPDLLFFVHYHLDHVNASVNERDTIEPYLSFIRDRASGLSPTPASWIRSFVLNHEEYCKDSHVSEKACYDMMRIIFDRNGNNRA